MENDNVYSFKQKGKKNKDHDSHGNFNGKTDGDKFEIKLRKRN